MQINQLLQRIAQLENELRNEQNQNQNQNQKRQRKKNRKNRGTCNCEEITSGTTYGCKPCPAGDGADGGGTCVKGYLATMDQCSAKCLEQCL